ncbi:MAG: hypothetical protein ACRD3C_21230 [Vicinamibacterales bacterium]
MTADPAPDAHCLSAGGMAVIFSQGDAAADVFNGDIKVNSALLTVVLHD